MHHVFKTRKDLEVSQLTTPTFVISLHWPDKTQASQVRVGLDNRENVGRYDAIVGIQWNRLDNFPISESENEASARVLLIYTPSVTA